MVHSSVCRWRCLHRTATARCRCRRWDAHCCRSRSCCTNRFDISHLFAHFWNCFLFSLCACTIVLFCSNIAMRLFGSAHDRARRKCARWSSLHVDQGVAGAGRRGQRRRICRWSVVIVDGHVVVDCGQCGKCHLRLWMFFYVLLVFLCVLFILILCPSIDQERSRQHCSWRRVRVIHWLK